MRSYSVKQQNVQGATRITKRVCITGAAGFIGSHVLAYLLNNTDWNITCISSWRHKGNPLRTTKNEAYIKHSDRVEFITHDLTGELPDIGDFDLIFHLASLSHVDTSVKDPKLYREQHIYHITNARIC